MRILIAEDEERMLKDLSFLLTLEGYHLDGADHGQDALVMA